MIYVYTVPILLLAFAVDAALGDPQRFPHPVRFFGWMIGKGTKRLRAQGLPDSALFWRGAFMSVAMVLIAWAIPAALCMLCASVHVWLWACAEITLCWTVLAAKSLKAEGEKIYHTLKSGDLARAREQLSMIVGRDTRELTEPGIIRAVVETIAENTSDGVTAPMLYACLGGAPLALAYKAVNTLDSMIGYKNDEYLYFGRFAAKMDDVWNYIPARLTAVCMVLAAYLTRLNGKNAWHIYLRDRKKHASPNSAQTEAVCAGALGVALAGDASYFGKTVRKPGIGDALREIEPEDILRAGRLMLAASIIMLAGLSAAKLAVCYLISAHLGGGLWSI
ncbi:MAG TPA: cobalamin biosynthesis protein CobD [Clostridiales bacterium]|nr:cobalamin biosynthesis protein CobD [Clostridiales bacterium]